MAEAATLEKQTDFPGETILLNSEFSAIIEASGPRGISVAELDTDRSVREEAARFIGRTMLAQTVQHAEALTCEKPIHSLRDAIHLAAEGDLDAIKLVETNVGTDVIERTLKAGHIMDPIQLAITPQGKIVQYNQTGDSIQANSLQLAAGNPVMRARTEAETRNNFRIEDLHREGWFENHSLVVFSLAEDMPEVFFTETMSCSIQVTSKADDGLQLESAFVAGIAEDGARPHDLETIVKVGDMLGIDFRNKTKTEILDMPVLVPNEFIQDGAIDMVKLWDTASGGFFGENKAAPMSYEAYREYCHERTKSFQPKVELIRDCLIADAPLIRTRLQAVERLHQLSEEQMVEKAVEDHTIDPRVFGPVAAEQILLARHYEELGDPQRASQAISRAVQTADSKSCPWAKKQGEQTEQEDEKGFGIDEDEFGSLTFECTEGHRNRRPRGKLITKCCKPACKGTVGC
jgi:hypothetical protein